MKILVQKFGGTSVADLECMKKVREKVLAGLARGNKMVVVLSARSGETNRLLALADEWSGTPDKAECDVLVSTGEQVSIALFTMLLKDAGVRARSLLGWQIPMTTDDDYGRARITDIDSAKLRAALEEYDVLVVAGFQGCTEDGRITTLGRGGSDTSAVALAAALGSVECEIYTDVDGVYTTDPNICSTARKMDRVAYEEMLEMASMGAKVLHIRSVEFAKKYKVPVRVRSTFTDDPGTLVTQEDSSMEALLVSGIAYDKDQARVTLHEVPDVPGIAAAVFGPLSEKGVLVDMIVQNTSLDGHTDITFTVSRKDLNQTLAIMDEVARKIGASEVVHDVNVAKVSAIGVGMRNHSGVAARAFAALTQEGINILMISTSEIKITILIQEKYVELAVRILHDTFGLDWDIN
ncbi:MAG TPA: aspartate kinase [Candidatus Desulfovibrio gallistercoris]|uniref:aspartate kinase n=1 Tax=uncultured Desulfovibrio sp. TaxID=167968 RepID=UPI001F96DFF2|nr:aspartate kinase [uncultured Desulfovibrio sp.]HJA77797.1 aspartate kinase [Candidatus Desulfovibrio gallistercoris]